MCGTIRVSLHKHSRHPPKQCNHVNAATIDVGKTPPQNSSLTPKYRIKQFLNDLVWGIVDSGGLTSCGGYQGRFGQVACCPPEGCSGQRGYIGCG